MYGSRGVVAVVHVALRRLDGRGIADGRLLAGLPEGRIEDERYRAGLTRIDRGERTHDVRSLLAALIETEARIEREPGRNRIGDHHVRRHAGTVVADRERVGDAVAAYERRRTALLNEQIHRQSG